MFLDFDPRVFDDPNYKEDAVREDIIAPLLRRLGYRPTGIARVQRSKNLTHPFIQIGTGRHAVQIPDYTLYVNDDAVLVLDAKSPAEDVLSTKCVQQAYSYAIHPEVRCDHFAVCNGRALALFNTREVKPILVMPFEQFEPRFATLENYLCPDHLSDPELREFIPDLGLALLSRVGMARGSVCIFPSCFLGLLGRQNDELYTTSATFNLGDVEHMASFDLDRSKLDSILSCLERIVADRVRTQLSSYPFQVFLNGLIEIGCVATLGDPVELDAEVIAPLAMAEVTASKFGTEPVECPDIPTGVFQLQEALQ